MATIESRPAHQTSRELKLVYESLLYRWYWFVATFLKPKVKTQYPVDEADLRSVFSGSGQLSQADLDRGKARVLEAIGFELSDSSTDKNS